MGNARSGGPLESVRKIGVGRELALGCRSIGGPDRPGGIMGLAYAVGCTSCGPGAAGSALPVA